MADLRIKISDTTDELIKALAAAHRKKPADIVTLALVQFAQGERMEAAIKAMNERKSQRDDLALAIDLFQRETRALVEARERLEAESLMASYAVDDAADHQFPE